MSDTPTEGERRLRAAVRALLSRGVWLTIALELGVATLPQTGSLDALGMGKFALLGLLAALTVYLQAGTMYALARGREVVDMRDVVMAGKDVFPRFIFMLLKAGLLFIIALNVVLVLLSSMGAIEIEDQAGLPTIAAVMTLVIGPTKYVLAYWLPWVFTRQNFLVLPTLQSALIVAWQRFTQAGLFLALLLLLPGLVLFVLPKDALYLLHFAVLFLAVLLDWVAYTYCVDVVRPSPQVAQAPENS